MVTSLETREHRLEAVEAGASDFIAKPVDETELRIRSASLLKMKEAQDELKAYQAHLEEMCEERTAELARTVEALNTEVAEREQAPRRTSWPRRYP